MKELFYELHFLDRDDPHNPIVRIQVPNEREYKITDLARDLRIEFEAGYDDDEIISRDDWTEFKLDEICEKFGCAWDYVVTMGVLVIE